MIRFVVGQMNFQNIDSLVDRFHQPARQRDFVDRTHPANPNASRSLRHFVMYVTRTEHRLVLCRPILPCKTTFDATFAIPYFLLSTLAHSKCLSRRLKWVFATFFIRRKHRAFRVLFLPFLFFYPNRAWIGTRAYQAVNRSSMERHRLTDHLPLRKSRHPGWYG